MGFSGGSGRRTGRVRGHGDDCVWLWEVTSGKVSFMLQGWQEPTQREAEGGGRGMRGNARMHMGIGVCECGRWRVER